MPLKNKKINKEKGFYLIESLVTMLILTVGALGVAGLQATAMRAYQSSNQQSTALILAQNIVERIRANPGGKEFYDETSADIDGRVESACMTTTGCTPQQLAETDMYQWKQEVQNSLPQGQAFVCRDASAPELADLAGGTNLVNLIRSSCTGSGNQFIVHIFWEKTRDNTKQLRTNATGSIDPLTSDGYIQVRFNL